MDIRIGDVLEMKKNHPCGSHTFSVLRIGMDFRNGSVLTVLKQFGYKG